MKKSFFLFISIMLLSSCASSNSKPSGDSGYHRRQSWNESKKREQNSASNVAPIFSLPILWWTW